LPEPDLVLWEKPLPGPVDGAGLRYLGLRNFNPKLKKCFQWDLILLVGKIFGHGTCTKNALVINKWIWMILLTLFPLALPSLNMVNKACGRTLC
jgi:hypothetical protein